MNLTLIIIIIVMLYMLVRGYQMGFTKQVSGLIALAAAFVMLALGIMLFSSFQNGEVTNTVYSVILLAVFVFVYGIIKFLLRSIKLITELPILHFFDQVLGIVAGLGKGILIVWIFFLLCENNFLGDITPYVRENITESTILKLLYQYNFFVDREMDTVLSLFVA